MPVSVAQQSANSGSSIFSGLGSFYPIFTRPTARTSYTSQQEPVTPDLGMRPPTVASSEGLPDPINQSRAINTSQGQATTFPGRVLMQFLNIDYNTPSLSPGCAFKAGIKYGNVSYETDSTIPSIFDDRKEWCAHTHFYYLPCR